MLVHTLSYFFGEGLGKILGFLRLVGVCKPFCPGLAFVDHYLFYPHHRSGESLFLYILLKVVYIYINPPTIGAILLDSRPVFKMPHTVWFECEFDDLNLCIFLICNAMQCIKQKITIFCNSLLSWKHGTSKFCVPYVFELIRIISKKYMLWLIRFKHSASSNITGI